MKFAAILHDVRSVHNVGSIFRTADGAGFEKIYLCGITPSPRDRFGGVRPDFAKVALGAESSVAWEIVSDIKELIATLRNDGWMIFALEQAEGSVPVRSISDEIGEEGNYALIIGNEVDGVSPDILALVDKVMEIPMRGAKESLNVSVAFGIAAYYLTSPEKKPGGSL